MDFGYDWYDAATGDFEDEDEDDEPLSSAEDVVDDESLRAGVHMLGLSKSYVPSWTDEDAFRELFQNWFVHAEHQKQIHTDFTRKDAIIGSDNLDPSTFFTVKNDTDNEIEIKARSRRETASRSWSHELLGYIRYNKKKQVLEITSFKAALGMKHLSLGVSEKRNEEKFAGTHGEGFKLAALVFCRTGRGMRITSSSFYWNFGFRGRSRATLSCRLSKVKDTKLHNLQKQYLKQSSRSHFERKLTSNVWEDVTITISKARGDHGIATSEKEFSEWTLVTLDLTHQHQIRLFTQTAVI